MTTRLLFEIIDTHGQMALITAQKATVWMVESIGGINQAIDSIVIEQDPDGIIVKDIEKDIDKWQNTIGKQSKEKKHVAHR
jgi:hypothetical protein